eukprot:10286715-Prorocentrum_lima.AAC.1
MLSAPINGLGGHDTKTPRGPICASNSWRGLEERHRSSPKTLRERRKRAAEAAQKAHCAFLWTPVLSRRRVFSTALAHAFQRR